MCNPPIAYPVNRALHLRLIGDWDASGALEFLWEHADPVVLGLTRGKFSPMCILMMRAIDSRASNWFTAYTPTAYLVEQLRRHTELLNPDRDSIYRLIWNLRKRLADAHAVVEAQAPEKLELTSDEWTHLIVESHPQFGYRLGVPPENLSLVLGGRPYQPARNGSTGS